MPKLGVNVAIIRADRVLLTGREDVEIWCLPGGSVDVGESVAQAAIREAREETGLEVRLTRLVGVYSVPRWQVEGLHLVLFAAESTGGALRPQVDEVIEMGYSGLSHIPAPIMFGHRQRILDALAGVGAGVAWSQDLAWSFEEGMGREEIYRQRDRSGLSRQEFYVQYLKQPGPEGERLEVSGDTSADKTDAHRGSSRITTVP